MPGTNNGDAAVLALKPTGFNYDLCPAAIPLCGLTHPPRRRRTTGPAPPVRSRRLDAASAVRVHGRLLRAHTAAGVYNVNGLNGNPLTVNGNANNHQHWTQVYCGHEIQINETLTSNDPVVGGSDPIKTGSVYGFRNLNAKQSARTTASPRASGTSSRSARSASSTRSWSTAR